MLFGLPWSPNIWKFWGNAIVALQWASRHCSLVAHHQAGFHWPCNAYSVHNNTANSLLTIFGLEFDVSRKPFRLAPTLLTCERPSQRFSISYHLMRFWFCLISILVCWLLSDSSVCVRILRVSVTRAQVISFALSWVRVQVGARACSCASILSSAVPSSIHVIVKNVVRDNERERTWFRGAMKAMHARAHAVVNNKQMMSACIPSGHRSWSTKRPIGRCKKFHKQ